MSLSGVFVSRGYAWETWSLPSLLFFFFPFPNRDYFFFIYPGFFPCVRIVFSPLSTLFPTRYIVETNVGRCRGGGGNFENSSETYLGCTAVCTLMYKNIFLSLVGSLQDEHAHTTMSFPYNFYHYLCSLFVWVHDQECLQLVSFVGLLVFVSLVDFLTLQRRKETNDCPTAIHQNHHRKDFPRRGGLPFVMSYSVVVNTTLCLAAFFRARKDVRGTRKTAPALLAAHLPHTTQQCDVN